MIILLAQAESTGRIVNWSQFKRSELINQNRFSFSPTTVIPDVIVDIINQCRAVDPSCKIDTIIPNGFISTNFDIVIHSQKLQVACGRRLTRGYFPLNPFAAEFGSNFDVLVTISANTSVLERDISSTVTGKYKCKKVISPA